MAEQGIQQPFNPDGSLEYGMLERLTELSLSDNIGVAASNMVGVLAEEGYGAEQIATIIAEFAEHNRRTRIMEPALTNSLLIQTGISLAEQFSLENEQIDREHFAAIADQVAELMQPISGEHANEMIAQLFCGLTGADRATVRVLDRDLLQAVGNYPLEGALDDLDLTLNNSSSITSFSASVGQRVISRIVGIPRGFKSLEAGQLYCEPNDVVAVIPLPMSDPRFPDREQTFDTLVTLYFRNKSEAEVHELIFNDRLTELFVAFAGPSLEQARKVDELRQNLGIGEVLDGFFHDLTGPLSNASTTAQVLLYLKEKGNITDEVLDLKLRVIVDELEQLAAMQNSLRKNIREGTVEMEMHPTSGEEITALLNTIYEGYKDKVTEAGLFFDLEIDENVRGRNLVSANLVNLRRVVDNYVSNSLRYTQAGKISLRAYLTEGARPKLAIDVEDTGLGIEEKHLHLIFKAGKYIGDHPESTGIGLAMCKLIASMHGGSAFVRNTKVGEGSGSTFAIEIPLSDN